MENYNNKTNWYSIQLIIFGLLHVFASHAAIIMVNNSADLMQLDGNCDLRDAITAANTNMPVDACVAGEANVKDEIFLINVSDIQLQDSVDITSSMDITNVLGVQTNILAASNRRIFNIFPSSSNDNDLSLVNLKFIGGSPDNNGSGGAIQFYKNNNIQHGDISIVDCIFENNQARLGGAIYFLNPWANNLIIQGSTFINNQANDGGGAIYGQQISNFSLTESVVFDNNLFESNHAGDHSGAFYLNNRSPVDIVFTDNRFIANSTLGKAGALNLSKPSQNQNYLLQNNVFLYNEAGTTGGGLLARLGVIVYIQNSTFAFNRANNGGAIATESAARYALSLNTLAYNQAELAGDNILLNGNADILSMSSNIIAHPINGDNCSGSNLMNVGGIGIENVVDDESCEILDPMENIVADPKLSGLTSNGSDFPGFLLSADSPAIDRRPSCLNLLDPATDLFFDQQNNPRPIDGDGNGSQICDIGAIEGPENNELIWLDGFGF